MAQLSRKEKKLVNKQKRLYYKVLHQEEKPNVFIYGIEIFFSFLLEFLRRLFKFVFIAGLTCCIIGTIGVGIVAYKLYPTVSSWYKDAQQLVANSTPDDFKVNESSYIYGSDGNLIATLCVDSDLEYIPYEDIPVDFINVFIAVEDRTFWENPGFDIKGMIRVVYNAIITKGDELHGASTITQQLARGEFLTREVSIERKVKEIMISYELTNKYSKEQIMEFYLNNICFANNIYGIGGASKAYFNKGVSELTTSEIAYLAAIPNRPSYYNPYKYPENALDRRDKILGDMYECLFINHSAYLEATLKDIIIEKPIYQFNNYETTFAVDCSVKYLMKLNGFEFEYAFDTEDEYSDYHDRYIVAYDEAKHQLYTKGYSIYTTLDSSMYQNLQLILDEKLAFDEEIDENTGIYALQGALTCIDNSTGKVVAVVGGRSQDTNNVYSLNRAYQSYRQPGSSIKPIVVYTPILAKGYTADSIVQDINVSKAKEKGVNVQKLTGAQMTLRSAVERSRNGVAFQLFDRITPKFGVSHIELMKFSNLHPNDYFNSTALGGLTYGVTTVEMASAYATLSNHGVFKEPTCLISVIDNKGNELYKEYEDVKVYTSKSADDMIDILKGVLIRGTGASLKWSSYSNIEAFAKTGTTNSNKDGWLCGSTPYYSIAVWVGYDTPRAMSSLYGNSYPGQIWRDCMVSVTDGLEKAEFIRDEEDESYKEEIIAGGYYSYLPGRDDSEVLSENYTVADYRSDRVIGESIYAIISQIEKLDMSTSNAKVELDSLYNEGLILVESIYSRKYTAEMKGYLDEVYNSK